MQSPHPMRPRVSRVVVVLAVIGLGSCARWEPLSPAPERFPEGQKRLHLTLLSGEQVTLEGYLVGGDSIFGTQSTARAGGAGIERKPRALARADVQGVAVERFDPVRAAGWLLVTLAALAAITVIAVLHID